jgi:ribonuclease Z
MSWLVQPRLINGPFDDPGLYLDFRFGRRAILFDLGEVSALSARELLRVSHVFVSHAHMDHMAGFDRLFRTCLHRAGPLTLVGPPGFIDRVDHRIRSFTWNLLGEDSADFRLVAMEFDGLRLSAQAAFHARDAFRRRRAFRRQGAFRRWGAFRRRDSEPPCRLKAPPSAVPDALIGTGWEEDDFRVEATILDHGIPSLAFALQEPLRVNVLRGALERAGFPVGPWLAQAKQAVRRGDPDVRRIEVPGHGGVPLGELKERFIRTGPGQRVAYVTDAAPSVDNRHRIVALARQADQLFIEAVFLHRDRALAEATRHLTARDAGEIAREAGARFFTVFHHSARYLSDPAALTEARDAFRNGTESRR